MVRACACALLLGCAPSSAPASSTGKAAPSAAAPAPALPEYVLADADRRVPSRVALAGGDVGLLVDGMRIVVRKGALVPAGEIAKPALAALHAVPPWLGGGFLFRGSSSLFRAGSFDGPLAPVLTMPGSLLSVSFGPKHALVRDADGERVALDPATGASADVTPLAAVDVASLGDGRAAALLEAAGAAISLDGGAHWKDVTEQLDFAPAKLHATDGDLFLMDEPGALAVAVGRDGSLTPCQPPPSSAPPPAKDPRVRGTEPPLRLALRSGAPVDARTAVVAHAGDVMRVDLATGALVEHAPGLVPPDLACEATAVPGDVVLVCAKADRPSVILSGLAKGGSPRIERTFSATGAFYASEGALVFGGPCTGSEPSKTVACVRDGKGGWVEHRAEVPLELPGPPPDGKGEPAKAPPEPADRKRPPPAREEPKTLSEIGVWVASVDGRVLGLLTGKPPGAVDPRTGDVTSWRVEATHKLADALSFAVARPTTTERILDRRWSLRADGTLRGWLSTGEAVRVVGETVEVSPFAYGRVAMAGPFAFGRGPDGRAFQTVDHGEHWKEVASPPGARETSVFEPLACSPVGCDLRGWYRLGWPESAPSPAPVASVVSAAAVQRPHVPELVCAPSGEVRAAFTPPTDASPNDLGLGSVRLALAAPRQGAEIEVQRRAISRGPVNPPHGLTPDASDYPRALVHGFMTRTGEEGNPAARAGVLVLGPNPDPRALERAVGFVEPFDPEGSIRRGTVALSAIIPIAKAAGIEPAQVFSDSGRPDIDDLVPIAPHEARAKVDLLFTLIADTHEIVGRLSSAASPRVSLLQARPRHAEAVSAAATGPDAVVVLAVTEQGRGIVQKIGPTGVSELGEIPAPPTWTQYPAVADAIAVSGDGTPFVVRMPSGSRPPTEGDPALRIPIGGRPTPLAPWSTLTSAAEPACASDANGVRAIVQTPRPWLAARVSGTRIADELPMLALVRWSEERVCLEAIEVSGGAVQLGGGPLAESWIVARMAQPSGAARITVGLGIERRQAMSCSIRKPAR